MADEQQGDARTEETKVGHKVVDDQDTAESAAVDPEATKVGAPAVSSPEGGESPAEAQRAGEGLPPEPAGAAATAPAGSASRDEPEGTGPGGAVRGGHSVGGTGPGGASDVRGPADTGAAGGGQSPAAAQRSADEGAADAFAENPHFFVAGAFLGGLVLAAILKRLGGDDD